MLLTYSNFDRPEAVPEIVDLEVSATLDKQAAGDSIGDAAVASDGVTRGRPRITVTAAQRTAVLARYAAGESAVSIARSVGASKTAVLSILHIGGATVRYPRLTSDERVEICALHEARIALVDIARKFGRDPGSIWHVLNRAGLVGRRRS